MKVAIIGGSGKMGRWFARFLLKEGKEVVLIGRSQAKLEEAKRQLNVKINTSIEAAKQADAVLISVPIDHFEEVVERHNTLVAAEAAIVHRDWFRDYSDVYHGKTAQLIHKGEAVDPVLLEACRQGRERLRDRISDNIKRHNLSALLAPATVGPPPQGLDSTGDPVINLPWTHAGMPVITLPAGRAENGLPLGLQFVAPFGADEYLVLWCQLLANRLDDELVQ